MPQDVAVSIIIPTWNGERFIANCLESLRHTCPENIEILVVDNGSLDATPQIVAKFPNICLISNVANRGFSAAVNQGLQLAHGDILFLLNQDTVAHPDWPQALQRRFTQDAQLGILGCKLLYPDGRLQHAGGRLLEPNWMSEHVPEDFAGPLDFVTGAAFAIRRECFSQVGLFDTGYYPAYYEDVDYCLRARLHGWNIACELNAQFTHFESQSQTTDMNQWIMHGTQRLRLALIHGSTEWLIARFFPSEQELIKQNKLREWRVAMANVYLMAAIQLRATAKRHQVLYSQDVRINWLLEIHHQILLLRQLALGYAFET